MFLPICAATPTFRRGTHSKSDHVSQMGRVIYETPVPAGPFFVFRSW
ncbi:hypothetical protein ACNKHL_14475 [Shigella flexneri]